ncbi:glycosyltransferase [Anaerosacchariphilus polymeriproducens]|uniref:Glycosyltransferase family 2 protein n=1 Tax=Anaerosacchariphilus polymeriproducens TaxID=1812858 RepID=A0A371ARF0_9FIRM|nr:glycosyltransferase [Anaerosacchariphilus polymeriproducens]RDU22147.1 glycosyltransferase family 2 protein [Anaerosacchariphilus polymeriproducens]
MNQYTVDVVIPTYQPDITFITLLERLDKQTYPINEIIIMNTEESFWKESDYPEQMNRKVFHLFKKDFDHGAVRAEAALKSKADIILFMTQDAVPKNKYLVENLIKAFDDNDVGAAYARQLPRINCKMIEAYTRNFNYPGNSCTKSLEDIEELGIKTFFCSNVCAAYRKDIYMELGGFERRTIFNEDMIYAGKMVQSGMKIAYVAEAEVIHSHNYSYIEYFKRNFDLAVSQKEHPEVFENVRSESEGIKMVRQTAHYLYKNKKSWMIVDLILQSGFKWLGYKLGKSYNKLPRELIRRCTMNQTYWEHQ